LKICHSASPSAFSAAGKERKEAPHSQPTFEKKKHKGCAR